MTVRNTRNMHAHSKRVLATKFCSSISENHPPPGGLQVTQLKFESLGCSIEKVVCHGSGVRPEILRFGYHRPSVAQRNCRGPDIFLNYSRSGKPCPHRFFPLRSIGAYEGIVHSNKIKVKSVVNEWVTARKGAHITEG